MPGQQYWLECPVTIWRFTTFAPVRLHNTKKVCCHKEKILLRKSCPYHHQEVARIQLSAVAGMQKETRDNQADVEMSVSKHIEVCSSLLLKFIWNKHASDSNSHQPIGAPPAHHVTAVTNCDASFPFSHLLLLLLFLHEEIQHCSYLNLRCFLFAAIPIWWCCVNGKPCARSAVW